MKSKMSYKAKRNAIVIAIIALLVILASTGIYAFIKGNSETQATSETNGTSQDRASEEIEQAQNDNNGQSNPAQENDDHESDEDSQEPTTNDEDNNIDDNEAQDNNYVPQDNNGDSQRENTQTITTIEEVETTNTVVGFETADMNVNISSVEAKLPNIESEIEAVTGNENNYVANGKEITYNIKIKNNGEALSNINVSTIIPEGTEIIEDSISDEGILENGEISWKVDIDTEKTLSFKVTVTKESGEISLNAIVNGKQTNTVTNVIDEKPVVNVIDPNRYQIEVGSEYVEKGYSAIDKEDGDITDKVVLSYRFQAMGAPTWENPDPTELDTNRLGVYKITYTVTDSRGNTVKGTRVVEIVDTQDPKLNIENLSEAGFVNTKGDRHVNVDDASPFTTEVFDKDGKLLSRREGYQLENGSYHDRFNIKRFGEGTFTIKVTDKAGNETKKTYTVDTIDPEINIKDGSYINTNISPRIKESNLESATISKDGGEAEEYPITEGIGREISKEGKYTITLKDKAGNETVVTFTIDKTAPSMKVGEKVYGPNTTEIIYSTERFRAETIDELSGMEQIYTNGHKRDRIDVNGEGKYTFRLVDKAGNESIFTVIVDKTAPVRISADFYVTGKKAFVKEEGGNKYQFFYAKNGDKLVLNAKFKEELAQVPTFTLIDSNKTEYVLTAEYVGLDDKGGYTYTVSYNIAEDESNLPEGEITFKISNIIDKAGNVGEDITKTSNGRRIIYDRTNPEIKVKEESIGNEPYFSNVSFKLSDNIAVKEFEINEKVFNLTPNTLSDANYENIKKHLVEDKNTILLRDMAGNEIIYEFYFDNTPARRSATNILVYGDKNENKEFYAKIGDTIQTYISFNEKLAHNPKFILINNGKEFEMDTSLVTAQEPNKDGKYIYQVLYKIEDNTEFVDGEITLRVTDLEDMYGNKIPDETKPTNGHKVYFDTTAPILGEGHPLYILNRDDKDNRKYIGDNEYLRVEANFNEELAEEPILTIGTGENTQVANLKSNKYSEKSGNYVYVWDIKLDNSILKLEDGTVLPFTITNVKDLAGNETSFNNDNVSYTDEYGQVIYDNAAPKYKAMGIFNWTNNKYGGDVKYASKDEHIRLFVAFPEMLAVNPKVDIYGEDGTVTTMELVYGEEAQFYYVEFDTTNELNLPQGKIEFKIYGYEDEAGNVGEELTDNDTTDKRYPEVVYDSIAPSMKVEDKVYGPDTTETIYSAKRFKAEAIDELSGIDKIYANEKERPSIDVNGESSYTFRLVDKAGNESKFNVIVDKTAPTPTFSYSNYSEGEYLPTNNDVKVTLNANEAIKNIDGWNKVDDKTFTKEYSKNGEYKVTVEDLAGNTSTVTFTVKGIDKEAPELKLNGKSPITIEAGEKYDDDGAIAIDNVDGTVDAKKVKINYSVNGVFKGEVDEIDTTKPGLYKIVYQYTDTAGNVGTDGRGHDYLIRNVIVEEQGD